MIGDRDAPYPLCAAAPRAVNASPSAPSGTRSGLYRSVLVLTGVWTASGAVLYLVAPLTAPVLLALAMVAPLAWCRAAHGRLPWHRPSAVVTVLTLCATYLLINGTWSLSAAAAYTTVTLFFVMIGVLHVTPISLHGTPADALRAMAIGLLAGMAVAGAIISVELASGQWGRGLLMSYHLGSQSDAHYMHVESGHLILLQPYLLNRSIGALALTFWPAILVLDRLALSLGQRRLLLAAFSPTPLAIFASHHATSKMAFAGAAAIYAIGRLSPVLAKRLLVSGWIVATLLVIPLAALAYRSGLHQVGWLDYSARHRIVIWEHTRSKVAEAPVLGAGISTARALHAAHTHGATRTEMLPATALHSHNAYLQVWYEAGAVGALLLLALGLLVLRAIAETPVALQCHLYAAFTSCALLAATSFSIWQPWFISALAMSPVFAGIGIALASDRLR